MTPNPVVMKSPPDPNSGIQFSGSSLPARMIMIAIAVISRIAITAPPRQTSRSNRNMRWSRSIPASAVSMVCLSAIPPPPRAARAPGSGCEPCTNVQAMRKTDRVGRIYFSPSACTAISMTQ